MAKHTNAKNEKLNKIFLITNWIWSSRAKSVHREARYGARAHELRHNSQSLFRFSLDDSYRLKWKYKGCAHEGRETGRKEREEKELFCIWTTVCVRRRIYKTNRMRRVRAQKELFPFEAIFLLNYIFPSSFLSISSAYFTRRTVYSNKKTCAPLTLTVACSQRDLMSNVYW